MKKKFKVFTLGCRTNQYESGAYINQLKRLGYLEAEKDQEAEVCIVNSCTVTEKADRSSVSTVKKLLKKHPKAKIFVTGCMVENKANEIKALNSNVEVVGNLQKEHLISRIHPELEDLPEFKIEHFEAHTRAFVKIQDGCDSFCTYCVIPYVRGRSRSRKIPEILQEIRDLVENGYKEIVLTGINIGDFEDGEKRLADLVRQVDKVEGLHRIRISSIDPDEVDEDLIDAVVNGRKTCSSMHIVMQSGSNVILKRMNRKYTRQIFLESVDRLMQKSPDFTFTTDAIIGFPGESDIDFEESMDLIKQIQFVKVHMFPYSRRPRTRAALYPDQVPQEVMKQRKQLLLRQAEKAAFAKREQFVDRTMGVLIEGKDESFNGYVAGHTDNFLKVRILCSQGSQIQKNQMIRAKLIENKPDGLIGKIDED